MPNRTEASSRNRQLRYVALALIIASLACSVPFTGSPTPTSPSPTHTPTAPPEPTATPQPLPPTLVESDPPQSVEVPLEGPITLYFNQPMDRASVEAALSLQLDQQITFTWIDDSTVVLYLSAPLEPETEFTLSLGGDARSAQGLAMLQPVSLEYRAAGYLRLSQSLPEQEAEEVDPSAAVVASFNRPIVALGADPANLPSAFTLQPAAQGRGEWLNTSTYIFYPEPPLEGGKRYLASLNPDLRSTDGGPLVEAQDWSFVTALPVLESVEPVTETPWPLDAEVALSFNQPMDPASVEANFSLSRPDGSRVPGETSWDEANTVFRFKPESLLSRDTVYTLRLDGQAQARGGSPLGTTFEAQVVSVPPLAVVNTEPAPGGTLEPNQSLSLFFSAPIQHEDVQQYLTIDPPVSNLSSWWDEIYQSLQIYGDFTPNTSYLLTLSPALSDTWGGTLGQAYQYAFNTSALNPDLTLITPADSLSLTPQDPSLIVQAVNLSEVPTSVGSLPLEDFFTLMGPEGYEIRQNYQSGDQVSWQQALILEPNRRQAVELFLKPDRSPLNPGLYYLRFGFPENSIYNGPYFIVVSNLQLTLKVSPTNALVWAVDLRTNAPLPNALVTLYDQTGAQLASDVTDEQGIFRADLQPREDPYGAIYAVIGEPGEETFGLASSNWTQGIDPWEYGIRFNPVPPGLKLYYYTDRPIYRPGQTVYFRIVARQAYNGRYQLPDLGSLTVKISGAEGQDMGSIEVPLSAYGTGNGEYALPDGAQPGYYYMYSESAPNDGINFQVANYRKPEINLQVSFAADQALAGERLNANIDARYFFGAPAGNLPLHWTLYQAKSSFTLPGYQVGPEDTSWLDAFRFPDFGDPLGVLVSEGDTKTDSQGKLLLDFPTEAQSSRLRYTLEVTVTDESGLPVSGRDSVEVNPAAYYIGLRPDAWVGRAGEQSGYEVQVVDWNKAPAGARSMRAEFQKVVWVREDPEVGAWGEQPKFTPQYTLIGSTDFASNDEGKARLAFTPPEPGTYQLSVFDAGQAKGDGALSDIVVWVGGAGQAIWPNLPNSRLRLTADKESYFPGDTARVFVPNPYGRPVQALFTIERSTVIRHEVREIGAEGYTFDLPLGSDEAPNIFLSATLLGRDAQERPDFRLGYLELPVAPVEQTLTVRLVTQPERAGPGDEISFEILVSDAAGKPVEGEFSLGVADLAALALADPNSPEITKAFYDVQPLGVRTSLTLAAYTHRAAFTPLGGGGGGGGEVPSVVRESFPDTAYWNASIVTGPDGRAQVSVKLPDTLTTWQVDARGTTMDTRVGQAQGQVITSKELLVRPATPRFLVVGDHVQLAAVVQNNTQTDLQVEAALQASGVSLDDPGEAAQTVSVPAGGRTRVEWWGTAQDAPVADLVFSAQGRDGGSGALYQDAARPASGALPILRYYSPQSFRTSGTMEAEGEIQELVSLPRSYDSESGELEVELAPSLASAMIRGLEALETAPFESTEQILSSFLPNLETYRTLQAHGIEDEGLKAQLDRTLNQGLLRLTSRQNPDGGWGWWQGDESDRYITSYVLFGLSRARVAGIQIDVNLLQRAVDYLGSGGESPSGQTPTWQLDRMVFEQYALALAGAGSPAQSEDLYGLRGQLSPWAQALLALTLESQSPGSPEVTTLVSDLETSAVRSAAGAHWEMSQDENGLLASLYNMHTTLSNSAVVTYLLAQRDPGAPLVAEAVRYLMAQRDAEGAWGATYTTAWTLMALDKVIQGTGELGGDFAFAATLNGNPLAQGQAGGAGQLTPVTAQSASSRLYEDYPNALVIERGPGQGRLYYSVALSVGRPVEGLPPLSQGLSVERLYYPFGEACQVEDCPPIQSAQAGEKVTVRLTLSLPNDAYFLAVEDFIPAGAELLDTTLKTTQVGEGGEAETQVLYDPRQPYAEGWGWWLFNTAQVYDDHIAWSADYLPAGTYQLTYTLVILQPGQYRVLPARAWLLYFPEVQGTGAGATFEVGP